MNFKDRLNDNKVIIFDGAMGTMLYSKGVPKGHCYDELNLSWPEIVKDIHQAYVDSGAEVIETNTFGANRIILDKYFDLGEKVKDINYYGAKIARQIARGKAFVAGSIGPISRSLEKVKELSDDDKLLVFKEQAEALIEGGVDLLMLETFSCVSEVISAIRGVRKVSKDIPIIASLSFTSTGLTIKGENPYLVSSKLDNEEVDVIGANCGTGPQGVLDIIKKIKKNTKKNLSTLPNAGLATFRLGKFLYPFNPGYFADYGKKFLNEGVKIIGGCCGTTPEHIKLLNEKIKGEEVVRRVYKSVKVEMEEEKYGNRIIKTDFSEKIKNNFVVGVEIDPPKNPKVNNVLKYVEQLLNYGVDFVTIADSPMAKARMNPIMLAKIIRDKFNIETIVHYTCRDRNILAIQADFVGANASDIRNFLVLSGDPPSIGDYPFATGVYDIDSIGLLNMIKNLNMGMDFLGNPLKGNTDIFAGAAFNPNIGEKEINRALNKIKNGANFFLTQPVFNPNIFKGVKDKLNNIPILAGLLILTGEKMAEYFKFEVPGIEVPDELYNELKGEKKNLEKALKISLNIVNGLKKFVNGVIITPTTSGKPILGDLLREIKR